MARGEFHVRATVMPGVVAVEAVSRQCFARHTHDEFGIGVILAGAQASASGRGPVEAGPGHVITVNPGEVHDGRPIGDKARAWHMLYLDPGLVGQAARDLSEDGSAAFEFRRPVIAGSCLFDDVQALHRALTRPILAACNLDAEARLLALIATLGVPVPKRVPQAGVRAALARINDDPAGPVTLEDLAAEAGLSRFQVLRAVTRATGLTPHAYLVHRRLGLARHALKGGQTLAAAAAAAGFADQSHMTRLFVRAFGMTPGAYAAVFR